MQAIQAFRRTFAGFHRRLAAAAGGGVSVADAVVLHHIANEGNVTPGQIAAFTGLTSGTVTSVIDRLENAGFVQRQSGTQDRRVVFVSLRSGAEAKLAQAMERVHRDVGGLFDAWDVERIEALVDLLDALDLDGAEIPVKPATGRPGR